LTLAFGRDVGGIAYGWPFKGKILHMASLAINQQARPVILFPLKYNKSKRSTGTSLS
jgi:hypothetical protein